VAEISVIIPAHNAEETLAQTLASVSAQTFTDIEIIVVDDGSTDRTADLCEAAALQDRRIRLMSGVNGGVARARNRGIAASTGAYVAPLDADDLWHPRKLDLQRERLRAEPRTGLVYNWSRRIGVRGEVLGGSGWPVVEKRVFHRHLAENFISNGSTPLIRRALLATVGYEPALRDAGDEGCEDYLLQLRLAAMTDFACVPAFLTGYRRRPASMSTDVARLIRSHIRIFEILAADAPVSARPIIHARLARFHVELARNRARRGKLVRGVDLMARAARLDASETVAALGDQGRLLARRLARKAPAALPNFLAWEASQRDGAWAQDIHRRAGAFGPLDEAFEYTV
jgi:glycosyltransferase involved in cell wall biosynthesis